MDLPLARVTDAIQWAHARVADLAGTRAIIGLALGAAGLLMALHALWLQGPATMSAVPAAEASAAPEAVAGESRPPGDGTSGAAAPVMARARSLSRPELSELLWRAAERSRVKLDEVTIGGDTHVADAVLTASVHLGGTYSRVKQFVGDVLKREPQLAVGTLTLARKDGSNEVDAQLVLLVIDRQPAARRAK